MNDLPLPIEYRLLPPPSSPWMGTIPATQARCWVSKRPGPGVRSHNTHAFFTPMIFSTAGREKKIAEPHVTTPSRTSPRFRVRFSRLSLLWCALLEDDGVWGRLLLLLRRLASPALAPAIDRSLGSRGTPHLTVREGYPAASLGLDIAPEKHAAVNPTHRSPLIRPPPGITEEKTPQTIFQKSSTLDLAHGTQPWLSSSVPQPQGKNRKRQLKAP